ncbi:MAG: NAD(P)H-hydrate dehydratase [Bacteroidales bacterium]|nr:NAD(P)H-hydrate dehydratase [Bacteroidales bacterium]
MKIFTADKIREIDAYTIEHEPVKPVDLMERAASAMFNWFVAQFERTAEVNIFSGPGNNGGDGLALARMLADAGYRVKVYYTAFTDSKSESWTVNYERLLRQAKAEYKEIEKSDDFPYISPGGIVIDAIFGSGLTRPARGLPAEIIAGINKTEARVVSVDIPSGLFSEDNTDNDAGSIIRADYTLSLQFPKLSFFFAENQHFVGQFEVLPIGLHPGKINNTASDYNLIDSAFVAGILKNRNKFDHKGNFGHALMVAGSSGKAGAAVLSSHATLRMGTGLLTAHVPRPVAAIIHSALPEAMVQCDQSDIMVTDIYDTDKYDALGIGPGLGTKPNTKKGLTELLEKYKGPAVIDADALNIISTEEDLKQLLSENTVLTPHPGEFRRLTGSEETAYAQMQRQREFSGKYGCTTVLKGAHSAVCLPDGRMWFNTTGNPGMATAGSGDVLTGMILGLLAQGYRPSEAAIAAVFIHGLAGDLACEGTAYESLIASDIIYNIGKSFKQIRQIKNK